MSLGVTPEIVLRFSVIVFQCVIRSHAWIVFRFGSKCVCVFFIVFYKQWSILSHGLKYLRVGLTLFEACHFCWLRWLGKGLIFDCYLVSFCFHVCILRPTWLQVLWPQFVYFQ